MTTRQAARRVETALQYLNMRERRMGLPNLDGGSHSWPAICRELQLRVGQVALETVRDGRPSMRTLEAVGAWVFVAMQVLDEHERVDPVSGDEVAA